MWRELNHLITNILSCDSKAHAVDSFDRQPLSNHLSHHSASPPFGRSMRYYVEPKGTKIYVESCINNRESTNEALKFGWGTGRATLENLCFRIHWTSKMADSNIKIPEELLYCWCSCVANHITMSHHVQQRTCKVLFCDNSWVWRLNFIREKHIIYLPRKNKSYVVPLNIRQ